MSTGNVPRGFPRILQWLLIGLMAIVGLAIGALGAKLAAVGGSVFFALMGLVMLVSAVLIARQRRAGIMLYALAFIVAIIWSIGDAGWISGRCFPASLPLAYWRCFARWCGRLWPRRHLHVKGPRLAWRPCSPLPCWQA